MKINDNDLKNEYRAYGKDKTSDSRKDCISHKNMVKAFLPDTDESFKTKIIDHVSQCHVCAQEFELVRQIFDATQDMDTELEELLTEENDLKALMEKADQVISETKKQRISSIFSLPRLSPHYVSLAAIVLMGVIGTWIFTLSERHEKVTHVRGPASQEITLIEPIDGKKITKPMQDDQANALTFEWEKYPETEYYLLKIFSEALILRFESEKIYSTRFSLPHDIMQELETDSTYFWMVTATINTDTRVESKLQTFSLVDD